MTNKENKVLKQGLIFRKLMESGSMSPSLIKRIDNFVKKYKEYRFTNKGRQK